MNLNNDLLVITDVDVDNYTEAIRLVGKKLFDNGYVKDSYVDAVIEREASFPTGLKLDGIEIAMPHVSGVHVIKPAVCVAKLLKPVLFSHMGEPETKVYAELLFMMAIKNSDEQIDTLKAVMNIFTNKDVIVKLKNCTTEEELYKILKESGL